MKLLPKWVLTGGLPASTDHESATCIEQTYKLYGAMQDMIKDYNAFADKVNADIIAHKEQYESDWETYQTSFRQEFQDFIDVVELKIAAIEAMLEGGLDFDTSAIEEEISIIKKDVEDLKAIGSVSVEQTSQEMNKFTIKQGGVVIKEVTINNVAHADIASQATKANRDANGNTIHETYATKEEVANTITIALNADY